ncbi:biotin--[acetyl-CoA-carboxylase] ligase [Aurantiacibacter sp. MUD11]|uniref:biotin--[acetyl-CoA-carboxylase] ligase n=1 Tax=Aurantiacibacter sp. MUD11 TaxID=3003265 RepID=UPI0022AAFC44|nr:biotin--[acetyl-CoA-carboxylase] ligase [Aurantiacibacter sp. MUD11]WAT18456.1 biotin--[acetyl-CoA-carboxylase] ligase [Aurantiacibacter sp. MUD11]
MTPTIEYIPETGSTNADLLARIAGGELVPEGHWLVADRQTAGRGRQGRSWIDAPGNFMGSTVVRLHERDPSPATLSFVAALAVYETVVPHVGAPQSLMLKWPNDVLLAGAKFCGLLLEMAQGAVVIGIGVNLAAAPEIEGRKTDALAGLSRDAFAEGLAAQLALELQRWREFGPEPIMRRWQAAAHKPGTPLGVHGREGEQLSGTFDGLDAAGALRLKLPDGTVQVIHAGDVMLEDG